MKNSERLYTVLQNEKRGSELKIERSIVKRMRDIMCVREQQVLTALDVDFSMFEKGA